MKYNTEEVASLAPDYLGFIFYEKSQRNYTAPMPKISNDIQKVGVFVNEAPPVIVSKIKAYNLQIIQLHGEESPEYLLALKHVIKTEVSFPIEIWKVFSVDDSFLCDSVKIFEPYADKFLFDTKGTHRGGNGTVFNWGLLQKYPSQKPFILSGGIGPDSLSAIEQFKTFDLPLHAIDINSLFETEPGRKNLNDLKTFINEL
jgi:phosphoribosylanthranilate isomerase